MISLVPQMKVDTILGLQNDMHSVAETFKPFDFPIIRIDLKPSEITNNKYKGTLYSKWATERTYFMCFVSKIVLS